MNAVEPVIGLQCQEYLTFAKAAILMGCSRQYVYKLVRSSSARLLPTGRKNEGKLAASRISSRMAFIRKADIEKMLAGNPYHRVLPTNRPKKSAVSTTKKEKASAKNYQSNNLVDEVLDYISGEEVMRIYKVKKSWLYTSAKRNQVPVCRIAGMNYYSRKHIDAVLGTSIDLDAIIDWLSPQEVAERYGINLTAVRSYAHRHKIPSKREFGHTYYSQSHFDELRRTDLISDNRYYTSAQVAEKYGLTKANIGVIAKKHHITKVKVGRNNLLVKEEFDKVMADRLTQFGSYRLQ